MSFLLLVECSLVSSGIFKVLFEFSEFWVLISIQPVVDKHSEKI